MKIDIRKDFSSDYITREAGEKLRVTILKNEKERVVTEIDFGGLQIASTSFFDEAFAKLALENWTDATFQKNVKIIRMDPHDREVFISVCRYRGLMRKLPQPS